jgi:opacity protein-like surface antigen
MVFFQPRGIGLASVIFSVVLLVNATYAAGRHDVVKNDTLSGVSQQHLGQARHWPLLHKRNVSHVKPPPLIYPGQPLRIRSTWYGDVLLGAGLGFTGRAQTLVMQPGINFGYNPNRGQTAYLIGIGGGHSFILTPAWDLSLGIEADYVDYGKDKGLIDPLINISPHFDTLDYSYKAKAYTFMGNLRLRWWNTRRGFIEGYASLGIARNTLSDYTEVSSAGSSASPMLNRFQKRSSTAPAFSVGIAWGYQFSPKRAIEMGYRYINTGSAKFKTPDVPSLSGQPTLSAGKLSAQLIYFDLRFG